MFCVGSRDGDSLWSTASNPWISLAMFRQSLPDPSQLHSENESLMPVYEEKRARTGSASGSSELPNGDPLREELLKRWAWWWFAFKDAGPPMRKCFVRSSSCSLWNRSALLLSAAWSLGSRACWELAACLSAFFFAFLLMTGWSFLGKHLTSCTSLNFQDSSRFAFQVVGEGWNRFWH